MIEQRKKVKPVSQKGGREAKQHTPKVRERRATVLIASPRRCEHLIGSKLVLAPLLPIGEICDLNRIGRQLGRDDSEKEVDYVRHEQASP